MKRPNFYIIIIDNILGRKISPRFPFFARPCTTPAFSSPFPANHALLYCLGSQNERELLWDWVNDNLPLEVAVYLATLSDTDFMLTLLGLQSETLCFDMELWTLYLLQSACYISSCFQTSVISI